MGSDALPLILIELVLVFGGVLLFGWWQLRSVRRDREKAAAERAARQAEARLTEPAAERGREPPAQPSTDRSTGQSKD